MGIASIQDWITMGLNNTKLPKLPNYQSYGRMDSGFGSGLDRMGSGFGSDFDRWGSGDLPFHFDRMDSEFDRMGSGFDSGFDHMDSGFDRMGSGFGSGF